jgi:hypothetical protein
MEQYNEMIGYEMGSSLVEVYTLVKTSPVDNFKHELRNDMATLFCSRSYLEVKFLGQSQTLGHETWPPKNSKLGHLYF